MEFQKNRQKLMLASFQKLVLKERPEIPGLLVNTPKGEKLSAALTGIGHRSFRQSVRKCGSDRPFVLN